MNLHKKTRKLIVNLLKKTHYFFLNLHRYKVETYIPIIIPGFLPTEADDVIMKCCKELTKKGIPYFVSWGASLGIYRDKKLISHDSDIDIDIINYHDYKNIDNALNKAGMILARRVFYKDKIQQLIYLSKKGTIFDIILWEKRKKYLTNRAEPGYLLKLPYRLVEKIEYIKYKNELYPIPSPPEKYFSVLYGKDWQIPKKSKNDWKDDCKIVFKKPQYIFLIYKKISNSFIRRFNKLIK